jgi:hypothetical protein
LSNENETSLPSTSNPNRIRNAQTTSANEDPQHQKKEAETSRNQENSHQSLNSVSSREEASSSLDTKEDFVSKQADLDLEVDSLLSQIFNEKTSNGTLEAKENEENILVQPTLEVLKQKYQEIKDQIPKKITKNTKLNHEKRTLLQNFIDLTDEASEETRTQFYQKTEQKKWINRWKQYLNPKTPTIPETSSLQEEAFTSEFDRKEDRTEAEEQL